MAECIGTSQAHYFRWLFYRFLEKGHARTAERLLRTILAERFSGVS